MPAVATAISPPSLGPVWRLPPGTMLSPHPLNGFYLQVFPSQLLAGWEEETGPPRPQQAATSEQGPRLPGPSGSGKPKWASWVRGEDGGNPLRALRSVFPLPSPL